MSRLIRHKKAIAICMIVLCAGAIIVMTQAATNDSIDIIFDVKHESRIPVFIDWFDPNYLIPHMGAPLFWCEIYDLDNSSLELTVWLFMSNDSFVADNSSYFMSYSSTPYEDTYTFIYQWGPEPERTHFDYYFQVYDGNATVKKPAEFDVFLDVQWDLYEVGGNVTITEGVLVVYLVNLTWVLAFICGTFTLVYMTRNPRGIKRNE